MSAAVRPLSDVAPDRARAEAEAILSDARYETGDVPRPLRGPLEWLGRRLADLADVVDAVPWFVLWLLAALVVGLVALAVVRLVRRRRARVMVRARDAGPRSPSAARPDPDALDRAAAASEAAGDLARALRLRFRAGLLRLDARGAIEDRPSRTTGDLRRALGSATFDELAATFEEVAYGGRTPTAEELAAWRARWKTLEREAVGR